MLDMGAKVRKMHLVHLVMLCYDFSSVGRFSSILKAQACAQSKRGMRARAIA